MSRLTRKFYESSTWRFKAKKDHTFLHAKIGAAKHRVCAPPSVLTGTDPNAERVISARRNLVGVAWDGDVSYGYIGKRSGEDEFSIRGTRSNGMNRLNQGFHFAINPKGKTTKWRQGTRTFHSRNPSIVIRNLAEQRQLDSSNPSPAIQAEMAKNKIVARNGRKWKKRYNSRLPPIINWDLVPYGWIAEPFFREKPRFGEIRDKDGKLVFHDYLRCRSNGTLGLTTTQGFPYIPNMNFVSLDRVHLGLAYSDLLPSLEHISTGVLETSHVNYNPGSFQEKVGFSVISPILRDLETEMFFQALEKRARIADIGGCVAEIGEIRHILGSVGDTVDLVFKDVFRNPMKSVNDYSRAANALAGGWLQWSYAVKPLAGTIWDLLTKMNKKLVGDGFTFKAKLKETPIASIQRKWYTSSVDTVIVGSVCDLPDHTVGGGMSEYVNVIRAPEHSGYRSPPIHDGLLYHECQVDMCVKSRMQWIMSADPDFILYQFGLHNPLTIGWEALRFSFIIDWFVKVGKYLDEVEALRDAKITARMGSTEHNYKVTDSSGTEYTRTFYFRSKTEISTSNEFVADSDFPFIQDMFTSRYNPSELIYHPKVQPGTMITTLNARAVNALALLVVLGTYASKFETGDEFKVPRRLSKEYLEHIAPTFRMTNRKRFKLDGSF